MNSKTNSLNWFEVPATDIKRAKKFYETVFNITMEEMEMGGMKSAMFPMEGGSGKANGCLTKSDMHKPSMTGCIHARKPFESITLARTYPSSPRI